MQDRGEKQMSVEVAKDWLEFFAMMTPFALAVYFGDY